MVNDGMSVICLIQQTIKDVAYALLLTKRNFAVGANSGAHDFFSETRFLRTPSL